MAVRQGTTWAQWRGRFLTHWRMILLWAGMALFAGYFSWLSDIKASNFDAHNHDLSHMWQSVWNVAHGHGFEFSLTGDDINVPRLSVHADYLLVLLTPFSWAWPHYTVLLVLQAFGVAAGAWFVERIARRWTGSRDLGAVFAGVYLLSGPLQFALLWNFHAIMFAPLCIFAAMEAIVYRRRGWVVWLWLALAVITKEQVGLIAGPLLWLVARWSDQRRLAWWLGGTAVAFSLLHFFVIIPALRDSGNSHFVWEFYYGSLGATVPEQLRGLLNPREFISRLWQVPHLQNIVYVLLPLAGLPLISPLSLLAIIAILPHWLADDPSQHNLFSTNHLLALIVLLLATMRVSAQRVQAKRWSVRTIGLTLLATSLLGSIVVSPLPWSTYADSAIRRVDPEVTTLRQHHRLIPTNAVVGYSRGAGAEWRDRQFAWLLPRGLETLDYAVVFTSERMSSWSRFTDQDRRLNEFFRSTPAFEAVYTQGRLAIYRRHHDVPLPVIPNLELLP